MTVRIGVWRLAVAGAIGVAGALALPSLAWAHVTIAPNTGTPGGYVREALQVPDERDDATTTQVQLVFPADHPLAAVSVEPVPGWTASVKTVKLAKPIVSDDGQVTEAVSSITWTGGSIGAGQFQEFPITLGPLPDKPGELVFKALQTYSDGSVVRWIDLAQPGQAEPDHPAPTLSVVAPAAPAATTTVTSSDGSATAALVVGGIALVCALASLGYTVAGRRRSATPAPPVQPAAKPKSLAGKPKSSV